MLKEKVKSEDLELKVKTWSSSENFTTIDWSTTMPNKYVWLVLPDCAE